MALSGTGSIAASSQVNVAAAAGTFSIAGTTAGATITTLNGVANSNVTLGTQTLTISNGSTTYAGIIGGTGGLSLTAGTETLSGTNTYTGATTINGGTLEVDGSDRLVQSDGEFRRYAVRHRHRRSGDDHDYGRWHARAGQCGEPDRHAYHHGQSRLPGGRALCGAAHAVGRIER